MMEITGYSPVPKGLSSLSHIVCALHANFEKVSVISLRLMSIEVSTNLTRLAI